MSCAKYRPIACFVLVATLFAWRGDFTPAYASDDDQAEENRQTKLAKKHFYRAEKLFALRRFDQALVEYEAAFEAQPLPDFLFNIGQCHVNLDNYREAIFSFRKYLKLKPNAKNRRELEEYIEELKEKQRDQEASDRPIELVPKDGNTRVKPQKGPFYTRWWFWTGVVAAAGATTAVLLYDRGPSLPATDLGNLDFPR